MKTKKGTPLPAGYVNPFVKDKSLAASAATDSGSTVRGSRAWTIDEIINLAKTAVDNALDDAGDEPVTLITRERELEFQLNAPEHRGRPALTDPQMALARAIWNADERTTHPESARKPEFKQGE